LTQDCKIINDTVRYDLDRKVGKKQDCDQLKNNGEGRGDRGPPPNLKQDRGVMKARIGGAHALTVATVWIEWTHRRRKRQRGEMIASVKDTIVTSSKMAEEGRGSRDPPPDLSENQRSSRAESSSVLDQESSPSKEERTKRNERKWGRVLAKWETPLGFQIFIWFQSNPARPYDEQLKIVRTKNQGLKWATFWPKKQTYGPKYY
jgi:hypothetical protein